MAGNAPFAGPPRPVPSSEIGNVVWDFIKKSAYHVAGFLKRHGGPIFIALVTVSLGFLLYAEIQRRSMREIPIATGPWGGVYRQRGILAAEEMEKRTKTFFGSRYRLIPRATNGFYDNLGLLLKDNKGVTTGFVTDGFGSPDEVAKIGILVPLEENVLHIFGTWKFLEKLGVPRPGASGGTQPPAKTIALSELVPHLQKERGRIYLGPQGSGTRQVAEIVLAQHGLAHLTESTHGVSNYEEMRAALLTEHIVLAFYCGPLNAPIVEQIANDNSCRLIGLNGSHRGALARFKGFGEGKIPKDTYRIGQFCPDDIDTVRTRTVLACPMSMSDEDAYAVTLAASNALRGYTMPAWRMGAYDAWRNVPKEDKVKFDLHPAAEMFLRGAPPTTPLTTLHFMLSTFGVWLVVEILKWITARIPDRSSHAHPPETAAPAEQPPQPTNGAPSAYTTMSDRLEAMLSESRELDLESPQAAEKCREWSRAAIAMRREVFARFRQGELTATERDTLLTLINELRLEVSFVREQLDGSRMQPAGPPDEHPAGNGAAHEVD